MKVVFMGTPDFAVPTLKAILDSGYEVVGVITATDKLLGRGKKRLSESPVKKFAVSRGLKVLQPPNLKRESFVEELRSLEADIQVVVAFRMLPVVVWDMPPLGTYNLHGSLLPSYRGAAPIHWAVANGEAYTGLTTFKLKHEIDTGSIAYQDVCMVPPGATTGDMHDRMMYTGAALIVKTLKAIEEDNLLLKPQDASKASHAPKVFHDDLQLDFSKTANSLYHFIHGMSPFPGAWHYLEGKKVKVLRVDPVVPLQNDKLLPGEWTKLEDGRGALITADGAIPLKQVQPEGKGKMTGLSFTNGYLENESN